MPDDPVAAWGTKITANRQAGHKGAAVCQLDVKVSARRSDYPPAMDDDGDLTRRYHLRFQRPIGR